jgi:hypothetical protein
MIRTMTGAPVRTAWAPPAGLRSNTPPFPLRFLPPTNITKYIGETNPAIWLEDFRLACWAEGADGDYFIIQYLPICIGEYV